ncbi:hypothetical protein OH76DRAFT_1134004 [Lentinus brumalis]|uniref:Uncharacterized protein n=1 Tax=Lentinus brumalis TaxID=2498619 RepID=A0A371CUL3_9APHY|nr:hypothetical protein OH76DRAFT_1134004 [Polyporus brumalis]
MRHGFAPLRPVPKNFSASGPRQEDDIAPSTNHREPRPANATPRTYMRDTLYSTPFTGALLALSASTRARCHTAQRATAPDVAPAPLDRIRRNWRPKTRSPIRIERALSRTEPRGSGRSPSPRSHGPPTCRRCPGRHSAHAAAQLLWTVRPSPRAHVRAVPDPR